MSRSDTKRTGRGGLSRGPTRPPFPRQAKTLSRRLAPSAAAVLVAAMLAGCGDHGGEGKDCPLALRAKTVSGFCVPRWVSLKRGEVYARKGPGKDYPALWIYHARGLPVQVVAETQDWRRVCDADGGASWVHRSMVDGRRTVLALGAAPLTMSKQPRSGGAATGFLNAHALASLERCQGGWCTIKAEGRAGWVAQGALWGVAAAAQCH